MKIKGDFEVGDKIRVEKPTLDGVCVQQFINGEWSKGKLYVRNTQDSILSHKRFMAAEGTLARVTKVTLGYIEVAILVHIVKSVVNKRPKYSHLSSTTLRIIRFK